jgi:hypothetical protein
MGGWEEGEPEGIEIFFSRYRGLEVQDWPAWAVERRCLVLSSPGW